MENKIKKTKNNKILWSILFLIIAVMSVWAVIQQNENFSVATLIASFKSDRIIWLIVAVVGIGVYVWLEGRSLLTLNKSLGYPGKFTDGLLYSASDIYCSAITPSATGGQPASAYFMVKRGVPGTVATVSLLVNLIMYTLSIVVIGILCLIFKPDILISLPWHTQSLIYIGIAVQIGLVLIFLLLLWKSNVLWAIGDGGIKILGKLRLLRKPGHKRVRLRHAIDSYRDRVHQVSGQRKALIKSFIYNLLQRAVLTSISGFVCLAMGGSFSDFISVSVLQAFVILGASWIPIPGAMGVTDLMLIEGFESCWPKGSLVHNSALNLELCSRGVSFYACVLLCGGFVLFMMLKDKMRRVQ